MIKEFFKKLKIAFFTKRCELCGEVVCFDEKLCDECISLRHIEPPLCKKCGCSKNDCICRKFKREAEYKSVIAPFYYGDNVAKGILNLKMHDMPRLAEFHGKEIANSVKNYYELIDFDFVTFVPMREADVVKRGFNQAELLAKVVSRECDIPLVDALLKKRKTRMQKRQKATKRFANMYNAFDIKDNVDVAGKTILLVDDVKTTGSTLTSIALTLKAYGASAVYCAVTAIVCSEHS